MTGIAISVHHHNGAATMSEEDWVSLCKLIEDGGGTIKVTAQEVIRTEGGWNWTSFFVGWIGASMIILVGWLVL